jgi:hypothetical protein
LLDNLDQALEVEDQRLHQSLKQIFGYSPGFPPAKMTHVMLMLYLRRQIIIISELSNAR